ncbi:hypothetical protein KW791_00645 [Candidatus Parcubacteria bacterium]|nr:hypothetical protein [Candidatus Parcubacteria bacterium]
MTLDEKLTTHFQKDLKGDETVPYCLMPISKLKKIFFAWVRERVPEESKESAYHGDTMNFFSEGFNDCRSALLQRLEEEEK